MTRRRTDKEVMELMMGNSLFNLARQQFSFCSADLEQAAQQRQSLSPIERRRMEFEAVEKIAAALGVEIPTTKGTTTND